MEASATFGSSTIHRGRAVIPVALSLSSVFLQLFDDDGDSSSV
jgi:hypothetical protein